MSSQSLGRQDELRRALVKRIIILLWVLVPTGLTLDLAVGQPGLARIGVAVLLAAAPSAVWLRRREGFVPYLAGGLALVGMAALLAATLAVTPYAAGGDVGYVAVLGLLAGFGDRRVQMVAGLAAVLARSAVALMLLPVTGDAPGVMALFGPAASLLIETAALAWLMRQRAREVGSLREQVVAAEVAAREQERALRLLSETASDLAGRATEERLALQFEDDVGQLVASAARAADGVRGAVLQISGVAEDTARQTAAITDASAETSASAQSVASSVEQLAASVARATREIREVSDASFRAMEEAGATNVTVQQLADAAGRIGNVVKAIKSIADQTNLLALNATIEAARAGEAGKGFSVVAGAVKALARQTARATQDIEVQVQTIESEMGRAMTAIDGIATTVAHLGGITVSVAGAMDEQATVAQEIADAASRAAASTASVVANLRGLTDGAARADAAAREGGHDADRLAQQCQSVDAAVKDFVRTLIAA